MKIISLATGLLVIILFSSFGQYQVPEEGHKAKGQVKIGGFFSFDSKLSTTHGQNVWFSGGTFGAVINNQMRIGLGGYSLESKSMFEYLNPEEDNQVYQLNTELGYFGVFFEYVFLKDAPFHITTPVLFAGGRVIIKQEVPLNQLTFPDPKQIESIYWATVERSNLAIFEPGINLELEIFTWLNLDLGASYRFVIGSHLNTISNTDPNLSSASFHTGLKFRCF